MKNINEVLREKEEALARLTREVEALRIAAPLLAEQSNETVAAPIGPQRAVSEPEPFRNRWP
jgi:uncharacterized membrane protein YccC